MPSKFKKHVTVRSGKRVTVYGKTQAELNRKIQELTTRIAVGKYADPNNAPFDLVAECWLKDYERSFRRGDIAESTYVSSKSVVKNHVCTMFEDLRVQDVSEDVIHAKLDDVQELSSSTRRKIHQTLHRVLTFAKRKGIIAEDPMEYITAPAQKNEKDRQMHCMTEGQARKFLEACEGRRMGNLFGMMLVTGAREGEMLALHCRDILGGEEIWIRNTLSDGENGPEIKPSPKTAASYRKIPLNTVAQKLLRAEMLKRRSEGREDHELLFSTSVGTFHRRQNLMRRHFNPLVEELGLPRGMHIHDLRHTFATLALRNGIQVHVVSKLLGHETVQVTLDNYAHALPDEKRAAQEQFGKIFA